MSPKVGYLLANCALPILIILTCIPLILEKIPRNGAYGFRTPYTLSSDEVWYRANRVSGITMVGAAGIWLALALILPMLSPQASDWTQWLGIVITLLAGWLASRLANRRS